MLASATERLPDVLVIGDSHSNALVEGCLAHGLHVEMLRFSGNLWHSGRVVPSREHGIWTRGLPGMRTAILSLRERLGGRRVLSPDIPVIGSFGFHLGRLVPPLGYVGHVAEPAGFAADPNALHLSRSFLDAYVGHYRAPLVRMAQRMARECPLVVVTPPRAQDPANYASVTAILCAQLAGAGVRVFDPAPAICGDGVLDPAFLLEDGVHGNARYGALVVGMMLEQGLLPRPPSARPPDPLVGR